MPTSATDDPTTSALADEDQEGRRAQVPREQRRRRQAVLPRAHRAAAATTAARTSSRTACSPTAGAPDLPADGVVTGIGTSARPPGRDHGQRLDGQGRARGARAPSRRSCASRRRRGRLRLPLFYLVDSAGARITDQIDMFPGRRHAGRIFHNQVQLSGAVPQICLLFGPSAAGGAYIPAFCDVVFMVDKNASMYLGSPRMAEMVIGEKVTLEEMGGARMHCEVSGCGDLLAKDEQECIAAARDYLAYLPQRAGEPPAGVAARAAARRRQAHRRDHARQPEPGLRHARASSTRSSTRAASSRSRSCSRASSSPASRASTGAPVGIVANQPKWKGGVLFVDSADKAARFIWLCDAFEHPAAVPGRRARLHDRQGGRARRASSATAPR